MKRFSYGFAFSGLILGAVASAVPIPIPNASFEAPPVSRNVKNPFGALPVIADWDETSVGPGDEFHQDTGVFLNTDPGEPDHINNAHLRQLAFISTLKGNAIRQELGGTFTPGRMYTLTVGVAKSLTFPAGDPEELEIALFYFVGSVEQIVASTFVKGSQVSPTLLVDFAVTTPVVEADDAWAGENIGVLIRPSNSDPDDEADEGFWDADNVRLDDSPAGHTLADVAIFTGCMAGPDVSSPPANCTSDAFELFDFDADSDIDLFDFAELEANWSE